MGRWLAAARERRDARVGAVLAVTVIAALAVSTLTGDTPAARTGPDAGSSHGDQAAREGADATRGMLVVWARGELTADVADTVAALPGVTAAVHVRSDTLGLVASRDARGTVVDAPPDGLRIPVDVAAVNPHRYAAILPAGADRDAVVALAPGRILLSETAARLRRIHAGGQLDLEELEGLEVAGVVSDGTVGRAEIVLHAEDATAAGLDEDGTVYVRHDAVPGAATAELTSRIERLVPEDLTARIVDVAAGQPRRRAPLVLSLAQVKDRFGEFAYRPRPGVREIDLDPAFADRHIVDVDVPILGSVTCHRLIIPDLRRALDRIVAVGVAGEIDPARYAGCFYPRRISTSGSSLSRHSWGIALDINVDLSHPDLGPPPHPAVVTAFEKHGFRWGGDFLHPDNHHFEWVGPELAAAAGR